MAGYLSVIGIQLKQYLVSALMTRQELFTWIRQQYGTEPEYPWHDWNAVLRHNDNNKFHIASEVNLCCTSHCILHFHRIRSHVYAHVHNTIAHSDNHSGGDNEHSLPCICLYF